ncbi:MAG: hypothetical protein FJW56_08380 [Actinobacteria bacterium]|nr:hypothetical protein [Actinomycetota bacterium]
MKKNYLRRMYDSGKILILSPDAEFNPEYQIEPDAINLRLHPKAMRFKSSLTTIDLLDSGSHIDYYESYNIPNSGLELKPGEIIFCKTLETVALYSDHHIGFVFGRRTIAGFGLSITLDQPKFPSGLPWNFPLQLKNNTSHIIKIYPYIYIAQLILIEYPAPAKRTYQGVYSDRYDNFIPDVDGSEKNNINQLRSILANTKPEDINSPYKIKSLIDKQIEIAKRRSFFNRWGKSLVTIILGDFLFLVTIATIGLIVYDIVNNPDVRFKWETLYLLIPLIISILIKIFIRK